MGVGEVRAGGVMVVSRGVEAVGCSDRNFAATARASSEVSTEVGRFCLGRSLRSSAR